MASLLLAVISTALVTGVVTALGAGGSYEKYLRYFCALLLTLTLLSPLAGLIDGGFDVADLFPGVGNGMEEAVPDAFLREFELQTEQAVRQLLENEYSLAKNACMPIVSAEDVNGTPVLVRVEVRLYTVKAAALTGQIRKRLQQACGCEIVITEDVRL